MFLGTCDRIRKTSDGENLWQNMMNTRQEITEQEFLNYVNIKDVLDDGETWEQYREDRIRENAPIAFYKAEHGLYFFQTAGFEFIWWRAMG